MNEPSSGPRPIALYFPWVREMTGAPRSALNLFSNLSGRWKPFLITDEPNPLSESMEKAGLETEILPLSPLLSLRQHRGLGLRWAKRAQALWELRRHQESLARILRRRGAAVVWARNAKGVLYAARGAKAAGCSYVWDVGLEDRSEGLLYLLHSWALRQADLIVTQAETQPLKIFGKRRLSRHAHKVRSLVPGIDPTRARALLSACTQRPRDGTTILCVGTIHPRKNQRMLLQAALPLLACNPGLRLKFAGSPLDGAYAAELQQLTARAALTDRVEFLGWRDDIPELMGESHVLVVASENEGIPQVVREAMFSGLAIVSSAVGGIPEVIDDLRTGLLYSPGDGGALRHALTELLRAPERIRELGSAAQTEAFGRFSLESWCRRYDDLLWSVVNHAAPPVLE